MSFLLALPPVPYVTMAPFSICEVFLHALKLSKAEK